MGFIAILIVLVFIILLLAFVAVYQIKAAGMNVTDFWSFIKANDTLDKLYHFSERYQKLSPQQQVLFLGEAEKIFSAFDKVPDELWEEDYDKYMKILNEYQDIKVIRWEEQDKTDNTISYEEKIIPNKNKDDDKIHTKKIKKVSKKEQEKN